MNTDPDWTLWRSFAAVVEHGSLSGAARALSVSQPTVGRHIETLETNLGIALFERELTGLKPNATALKLFEPVQAAQTALAQANLVAAGAQLEPRGTLRITASHMVANYVLPPIIADLRRTYPQIALEIVPADTSGNLLMREADIAIRMFRPTQLDLITKHLGDVAIVPVAHETYLAHHGTPASIEEFWSHELIGFDRSEAIISFFRARGNAITRDHFALRSDDQTHLWELAKAGAGITVGQRNLVRRTLGLVEIPLDLDLPALPFWLTTHEQLFTSHRIRAIYDALAIGLSAYIRGEPKTPSIG